MNSIIYIKGCRQHNLKNITLAIPKYAITAIMGVSGSGKSSLAFDTLYAEGQRRYLEFLTTQSKKWIKQIAKPDVDLIEGLSPTLAVGQGKAQLYAFGNVATYTEIYDFLALLYANIGEQHSPITGKRLIRYTREEIVHAILQNYSVKSKIQILAPIQLTNETVHEAIQRLEQMGFIRLKIDGAEWTSDHPLPSVKSFQQLDVIVDRLEMKEGIRDRLAPSVETALDLSQGILKVQEGKHGNIQYYTEIYVCPETGLAFPPLKPVDFNFNSPHGACKMCHGKGGEEIFKEGDASISKWIECRVCNGARLKAESLSCLIQGDSIDTLCRKTVSQLIERIQSWNFEGKEATVAKEIVPEIMTRLQFLEQVGLNYLQLNRQGKTLSDGEAQRIQLASQIGAKLSGILYILDEPSLGLHRQDIHYLKQVIDQLKTMGNTIILVEHEKELIHFADHVVELGPGAGKHGGEITFQGTIDEMLNNPTCLTGKWLNGEKKFPSPPNRKASSKQGLFIKNLSSHNIRELNLKIPLGCLVGICGVSGSGKSTLILDAIGQELREYLNQGKHPHHLLEFESFKRVVMSEKGLDRFSARSIPATYVGIMKYIRQLLAETRLAKARGYSPSRFSLNKKGGRCEACHGLGEIYVNMHLMPDLYIPCDLCQGTRFNYETLQIAWENKNISEILALTIEEASLLFNPIPMIAPTLQLMGDLGLGYLTLGQSFRTLSGGEIQRLKLVCDLINKSDEKTLYLLDEPSAGLHFEDIEKLLIILHRLVDRGHSIFYIEHHLGMLQQADWLIELGPGGGPQGGKVIFEGTPKQIAKADTPTGRVLKCV